MAPKEPTRAQLSSRLAYNAQTPAFLRRFQNHVNGNADSDEEEGDPEWEEVGGGRPAIPRRPRDDRPPIPTRPDDDPGSADEEAGDEAPQIVVLREGKHLSAREVENEKRREKGLPPLPETIDAPETEGTDEAKPDDSKSKTDRPSLSFSTSKPDRFVDLKAQSLGKRKIRVSADDEDSEPKSAPGKKDKEKATGKPKKPKKQKKALLSFGEDA
ncbi:hypothetical protein K525DRAFT_268846 [Schizophyllum commune Loenen D]|nr:hypothetical protein K525DRAFT_268846 [Schizophyllum commune Loenen D]